MKTLQELLALKATRAERLKALIAIMDGTGGAQARALTDAEQNEITEIRDGAESLETQIRNAQFLADQRAANAAREFENRAPLGLDPGTGRAKSPEDQVMESFSMARAVQQLYGKGDLKGAEHEADAIGRAEAVSSGVTPMKGCIYVRTDSDKFITRAADAVTPLKASNLVQTNYLPTEMGYKVELPLEALGARVIPLEGISKINVEDLLATAGYTTEGGSRVEVDVNIRQKELSARPMCAYSSITMLLQARAGSEAEAAAMRALAQAEADAVQRAAISGNGTTAPQGILGNSGIPNLDLGASGPLTFEKLLQMKNNPGKNDANFIDGMRGWLTNENVRSQLEALQHGANNTNVWDYNRPDILMGYKAMTTTMVPNNAGVGTNESALIFGIWANLVFGRWNFRRLVLDEITQPGKTIINWYSFYDHIVLSEKAFAKCRNIIAA